MTSEKLEEKAIFNVARQIDSPGARLEYLRQVCAADADLLQRVETLLRAYEEQASFLESPAGNAFHTIDQPVNEKPGTQIGPYKLLQQIGEGGMGTVYMAQQTEPVKRVVALKVVKLGMDSRQVIARFEAERQALALMDHPNIARVFDTGTTDSGRPYFVMELVKGVPLTKYCDEHRLTPNDRLELFIPVCQAIQHAHQKGIIHRDIKPSNVLVARYDGKPVPKVIDFGVAKATGQQLTERTLLTGLGAVVGTLEYMSPEQAELNQLDIDTRSDIYSLGVLLYELLTGSTPLERKRLKAAALLEVLRLIRDEEPPKPSTRLSTTDELPSVAANRGLEPRKLSGLVRGELDWIVMKALDKDRSRRYETANGFAQDIQHYLVDEPVQACPPSAVYRLRKFARRNKTTLLFTGLIAFFVVLAAGGLGWTLWDRAAQSEARHVEQRQRQTETQRAVSVALARAEPLAEQARKMPVATSDEAAAAMVVWRQADDALGQAMAALSAGTSNDEMHQHVADMRTRLANGRRQTELGLANAQRKENLFRDLDESRIARMTITNQHFDRASAAARIGAAFATYGLDVAQGRTDDLARQITTTEPEVREALLVALAEWSNDAAASKTLWSPEKLRALAEAADNGDWRKQYRAAATAGDLKALRDLSAEAPRLPLPASALVLLANDLDERGLRDEALELLRHGRNRHPADFWVHFTLGSLLRAAKVRTPLENEQLISCWRAAAALRPGASVARNNLGAALYEAGQFDEAMAELETAVSLDPNIAMTHTNMGYVLKDRKQLDAALVEFEKASDLDPKDARSRDGFGQVLRAKKRLDEAMAAFQKAIELDPKYAWPRYGVGNILFDQRRLDEATAEYRKAMELDPLFAWPHFGLGSVFREMGLPDDATAEFLKAIELEPKHAAAHFGLGNILFEKNRLDDAIDEYRKAIELDPTDPGPRNNLGNALRRQGRLDAAMDEYEMAIKLNPADSAPHNGLGNVFWAQKNLERALAEYQKAIVFNPKSAFAHLGLGNVLGEQKKFDEAMAAFQEAIKLRPAMAKAHAGLANILHATNRFDDAFAEFTRAVEIDPGDASPHFGLGRALHAMNRLDEAIAEFKEACGLDPTNMALPNDAAWLLATGPDPKLRDPMSAVEFAQQAVSLAPTVARSWNTLGIAQYRAGDWKAATDALNKSIELGKAGDSFDWFFLAMANWRLGDGEAARKHCDQAIRWMDENQPENEELIRFRAEAETLLELKK